MDSDDLPLNVSRETLQQNKLLKVIQRKLVRKVLDMIKKMDKDTFEDFWKEYSTKLVICVLFFSFVSTQYPPTYIFLDIDSMKVNIFSVKLGVMEDQSNKTRLSKLLRFFSSTSPDKAVSLTDYVERMKEGQDAIYYMCAGSKPEVTC